MTISILKFSFLAAYIIVSLAIMLVGILDWSVKHKSEDARMFFLAPLWPLMALKEIFKFLFWIIRALPKMYRDAWK